jgi:hypothetical protein
MGIRSIPLRSLTLLTSLLLILVALLAISVKPSLAAGEQERTIETVDIEVRAVDENGKPITGILIHCEDMDSRQSFSKDVLTNVQGAVIKAIPRNVETLKCSGGGSIYSPVEKIVPVGENIEVIFSLNFQTIRHIESWITNPVGEGIHRARVRVHQSNGSIWSRSTDENGGFSFAALTAGPARVEYSANGYQPLVVERTIREGSDLSASLSLESFPSALLLLIPGIVVLALRANMNWRVETLAGPSPNPNRILILTSLAIWGAAFSLLWFMLSRSNIDSLNFFHPNLSFPLFVPFFGFLGALMFVADAFRTGQRYTEGSSEFAFRLVLGPYVAVVMLLLVRDNLVQSNKVEAQATVAFFSGFLVVLVLQLLTEKGNEILGQWRATSRYEPSELAVKFHLQMDDDLKLREINLKYLEQLRYLPEDELRVIGRRTTLGEEFLVSLWNQLRLAHLYERPGREMWSILEQEGMKTIWDVAVLKPDRLLEIANKHNLNPDILMKFYEDCKTAVKEL